MKAVSHHVKAVNEGNYVMIPVKENEFLLPKHNEDCVNELNSLGPSEHYHPKVDAGVNSIVSLTEGVKESFIG
jgi:hypothetical protein